MDKYLFEEWIENKVEVEDLNGALTLYGLYELFVEFELWLRNNKHILTPNEDKKD